MVFDRNRVYSMEQKLISVYCMGQRVTISELRRNRDSEIFRLVDFINLDIFLHYT